jgi:hypothetical protein
MVVISQQAGEKQSVRKLSEAEAYEAERYTQICYQWFRHNLHLYSRVLRAILIPVLTPHRTDNPSCLTALQHAESLC